MKPFLLLLAAVILLVSGQQVRSQTVNWGCPILSGLADSTGQTLDSSYSFDLGAFTAGFTPTSANVTEWATNWHPFDRADYNPSLGYFTSSAYMVTGGQSSNPLDTLGLNFGGKDAYLWVYNSTTAQPGTEWLLARASSWVFPTYTGSTSTPVNWSTSNPTSSDVPVFGKQGDTAGGGYATDNGTYTLQTYSLVPEPTTAMLIPLAVMFVALRRRRNI